MKKIIAGALAAATILSGAGAFAFNDMEDSEDSLLLERLGVISGYEDGSFRPDNTVTRAEAITTIIRAMDIHTDMHLYEYESMVKRNSYPQGANVTTFKDYQSGYWANVYIQAGVDNGIISGFEDNTFRPADNVTVEQLFVMTLCALDYNSLAKATGGYPDGYIKYAKSQGIANNLGTADYKKNATRREVVACVANMLRAPLPDSRSYQSLLTLHGRIYEAEAVVAEITSQEHGGRIVSVKVTNSKNYDGVYADESKPFETTVYVPEDDNIDLQTGKKYKMYVNCYDDENPDGGYLMVCVPLDTAK